MPRPFSWCTHFECRGEYYRLKSPVLFQPYEGQPGVYRVHLGDRILILTLSDQDMHDIFRKVSPNEDGRMEQEVCGFDSGYAKLYQAPPRDKECPRCHKMTSVYCSACAKEVGEILSEATARIIKEDFA